MIRGLKVNLHVLTYAAEAVPPNAFGDKLFHFGVATHLRCGGLLARI